MTILNCDNNKNPSNQTSSSNVRSRIQGGADDNCIMSTTTTGIDNLDNNLLGEILTRLPAETVVGLKFMNKKLYNLISDPFFINKHNTLRTSPCNFFCDSYSACITQLSLDRSSPNHLSENTISFGNKYASTYIHDSCHGLLLVELKSYVSKMDWPISTLCILNPLTKKKRFLPSPCKIKSCRFGIIFSPTSASSPYYYKQYSVVCVVKSDSDIEFKIFMSEKGHWRDCNGSTRIRFGEGLRVTRHSVCFRGIIHWLTEQGHIIAFDLDKEESRVIVIPNSVFQMVEDKDLRWWWWFCTWLGVVEDEINLVVVTPKHEIVTWILYDYENNKWRIKQKDVIKNENIHEFHIGPRFFNGERFLLIFRRRFCGKYNWQEYDVLTGVSRSLHSNDSGFFTPHIGTLTEV